MSRLIVVDLRRCRPCCPWLIGVRVIIFAIIMVYAVLLVSRGYTPAMVAASVSALGTAAVVVSDRLMRQADTAS